MAFDLAIDPRALSAAFILLVVFLVLYVTFSGFAMVGITPIEVIVLLFLAPLVAWINVPIWSLEGVVLGINAAGAVIPVWLSIRFLIRDRSPAWKFLVGTVVVTTVAHLVARVDPERGILVPAFPIAAVALITGLSLSGKNWKEVGPTTYASGAMGTLIGADLLNIPKLVDPSRSEPLFAVIGGAATLDAIYLIALFAVLGGILVVAITKLLDAMGGSDAPPG